MSVSVMQWMRDHVVPRRSTELPAELRDASHRMANESTKLKQEVVLAAGGYANYERKAIEVRGVIAEMIGRFKQ